MKKAIFFRRCRQLFLRSWEMLYVRTDQMSAVSCDLWLVCHTKDYSAAPLVIASARRFSLNPIKRIYFISNNATRPDWLDPEIVYINEDAIPNILNLKTALKGKTYGGWILQQILKYSGAYYSERFVVIDCDTILVRPHLFFQEDFIILRRSYEYSPHYKLLEKKLNIGAAQYFSFVTHMMPFKSTILLELFDWIESSTGEVWYDFIVNFTKVHGMVFSEWDLYARFLIMKEFKYKFRPWINQSIILNKEFSLDDLIDGYQRKRNSVSLHISAGEVAREN